MDQTDERVQYRNSRNQSLDSIVNELADGLALITKSASVGTKDKYRLAYEKYHVDACCATMVRSAQQMLGIIAELKRGLLVNNYAAMIENARDELRKIESNQGPEQTGQDAPETGKEEMSDA